MSDMEPIDLTSAIGTTGLKQTGGFVHEEFLPRLQGRRASKLYREMSDNNSVLGAVFFIIKNLVRQVEWRVEPADESDAAKAEAEFVETAMGDMSHTWEDFISEVLTFLNYGWAWFEEIYKLRRGDSADPRLNSKHNDGKFGWRKIELRGQETLHRWQFDEDNGIQGMWQMDEYAGRGTVFLPIEKSLLFRTEVTRNNPEGRSSLRNAVEDFHYLKRTKQIEVIGIERDLAGMPIMQVPIELLHREAGPNETFIRNELQRMIQQVRRDERWGGLIPSELDEEGKPTGYKFSLLTTGGRRQVNTNDIIKRYETRIAMTFMAEFIFMGMDKVGTEALAATKTSIFSVALETFLDTVASVFNRFAIRRLQQLNGRPSELDPVLVHGEIKDPDLEALSKFILALAQSGILSTNPALERKLLEMAKLPQPPDEEDTGLDPQVGEDDLDEKNKMSPELARFMIELNDAIKNERIPREAAVATVAATLGIDPKDAGRFVVQAAAATASEAKETTEIEVEV